MIGIGLFIAVPGLTVSWRSDKNKAPGDRAALFGVSIDSPESHREFIELNSLPFPLISDSGKQIVRAYGVWMDAPEEGEGDSYRTERTTFVITPEGKIKTVLRKVDPYTHDRLLLNALYA